MRTRREIYKTPADVYPQAPNFLLHEILGTVDNSSMIRASKRKEVSGIYC
jgi:hypothetical protein